MHEVDPVEAAQRGDEATFLGVLTDAVRAVERAGVPYVLIGGLASATLGRPRWTEDVDLLVRPEHARRALAALGEEGFQTEETNPHWIFKGWKNGIPVDVIFWLQGNIYLDEEMLARAPVREFRGCRVTVAPPEDLIVIKAIVHDEQTPRHWHDALAVVAECELDWEYLLRRAQHGARRVLSLLIYAQSSDLVVPEEPVRALFETIYGRS